MAAVLDPSESSFSQLSVDGLKLVLVGAMVYVLVRFLNLTSPSSVPEVHHRESALNQYLLKSCSLLNQPYAPPRLWGRSGHLQTWFYAAVGRVRAPTLCGVRKLLSLTDGSTASFDLFPPLVPHYSGGDITMAICPGFCNHSDQRYIRTFVDHSQRQGYRCAVLNLLGAPPAVQLTAPRTFSYGCTWEFSAMVRNLKSWFPQTRLILVGFSLGGNIVCKYLGEDRTNQDRVLCGLSICQGYSAVRSQEALLQWDQGRRLYNFILTSAIRRLLLQHRKILFGPDSDLSQLYWATSLSQIDDWIIRRFYGYSSLGEYYEAESCVKYLHNVTVPLLLLNSSDDPLVPQSLLDFPKVLADQNPCVTFVLTSHGGHLGFFEGDLFFPKPLTWIDKVLVQYCDALNRWSCDIGPCDSNRTM